MAKRVSLFKILRRELGEVLTAEGYVEVPQEASERNYLLVYARKPSRKPRLGFWFQRNVKSSSVDANGSSFNLEFFRSLAKQFDLKQRERAFFLLTPSEREEMRALQNRVIEVGRDLESERTKLEAPLDPRHDVWMRYRDEEDIIAWASFIARLLPELLRRFESKAGG